MRTSINLEIALEALIFVLSVVLLSAAAETNSWRLFSVLAVVSFTLFMVVQFRKFKPLYQRVSSLEAQQAKFAHKASKYGLADFFNMQDKEEKEERNKINGRIIENGNAFALLCETGNSYFNPELNRHWPEIREKLERKETVRLLMINPHCEAKKLRDELGMNYKADIKRVNDLMKTYDALEVRFTNEVYCSVFFSETEMIYDPYHLARTDGGAENHLLAFHFTKQVPRDGFCYYQVLKEHFEILWRRAKSFGEVIDSAANHDAKR